MTDTEKAIQIGMITAIGSFAFAFTAGAETGVGKVDVEDPASSSFIEVSGTDSILSSGLRVMVRLESKIEGQAKVVDGVKEVILTANEVGMWQTETGSRIKMAGERPSIVAVLYLLSSTIARNLQPRLNHFICSASGLIQCISDPYRRY